ncbi:MAG TPA: DNA recombination protein RmuC, partial [Frankiaceae bacterium]|nr:DNA recombination protein RmuC [Frankiaceae bacterium]
MAASAALVALVAAALGAAAGLLWARPRLAALRGRAALAETEATGLRTALEYERRAGADKVALVEQSQDRLAESFRALSAQALEGASRQFLDLADRRMREAGARASGELEQRRQAVEHLVAPLRETLGRVEVQLRDLETARVGAFAALTEQVRSARQASEQLRVETAALVTALRKPQARGAWGEMQLRKVVEVAGMVAHCDFTEQPTVGGPEGVQRPDLVVHLAGGKNVVVDSKVPFAAFLEANEATDERVRSERLTAHARHLRTHVDALSSKAYWQRCVASPEFVVLFVPAEAFLAPALDHDPGLLEHAAVRKVVIATPTTLIALLRTVALAWTQAALADRTREVFELGRQLYDRLGTLGGHVDKLGRSLTGAVKAYNDTVGSLEGRVLVPARKLA